MALRIACDLDGTLADMEGALQREAERLFGPGVDLRARGRMVLEAVSDEEAGAGEGRLKAPSTGAVPTEAEEAGRKAAPATPAATEAVTREGASTASRAKRPLTERQMRELWAHVRRIENFWTTLKEIEPGAVSGLAALASTHGWEVIFLTQRPATAGDTAQIQSQWWLDEHGFRFPSVFVMNGSRGKVAEAFRLDAVVDDRPENCLDVTSDSSARSILIWRDDPLRVPPATTRLGITVVHSFADALEDLQQLMSRRDTPRGLLGRLRSAIGV